MTATGKEKKVPIFIDTIPSLLRDPVIGEQQKTEIAQLISEQLESNVAEAVTRWASLPPLMVHHDEYCDLLMEARTLFIWGYFYSCVAMCGITVERILKDMFTGSLLVISDGRAAPPNDAAVKDLESFSAKVICEFLIHAGVLDKTLRPAFKALGEIRNRYVHAGGKKPEEDARAAVDHLHKIVEGTVSIFKDFEIQKGKLVPKQNKVT